MKKSLIALAVMAAAGAASAQSSVQLYGIADVWLGSASTKVNGVKADSQNRMEDGGLSYSRVGLKGSEDLGNGLKANFVLEQGFNMDNGATAPGFEGTSFGRQATVGLSGGFGAVDLGRQATAYDDVFGLTNNTLDANVSVTYTVWDMHTFRANNTIKYTSPEFAGFSGGLSYSLGEDKVQNGANAGRLVALGGKYVNGPLAVAAGYQQEKGGNNSALLGGKGLGIGEKSTHTLLGASYDLGVVKLLAGFSQAKYEAGVDADKTSQYQLGVDVPLSSNLVLTGGYAKSKSKFNGVEYGKSSGFNAALVYSLSKRTAVYAALVNAKAEDVPQTTEVKANVYAVGVKHAF